MWCFDYILTMKSSLSFWMWAAPQLPPVSARCCHLSEFRPRLGNVTWTKKRKVRTMCRTCFCQIITFRQIKVVDNHAERGFGWKQRGRRRSAASSSQVSPATLPALITETVPLAECFIKSLPLTFGSCSQHLLDSHSNESESTGGGEARSSDAGSGCSAVQHSFPNSQKQLQISFLQGNLGCSLRLRHTQ